MNKNAFIGTMLVVASGALVYLCLASRGGIAEGLVGKAVWYLPYVVLVAGVRRFARVRGS